MNEASQSRGSISPGSNVVRTDAGDLVMESVPLEEIASHYGTPTFVYSKAAICSRFHQLDAAFGAFPHGVHYAVKANSNLAILATLAKLGAGFDIVSGGELYRVLKAGGDPAKIVFSGVAKSYADIEAALKAGVGCLNVESLAELERIQEVAERLECVAPIAVRVNPNVDPKTHPYISTGLETAKFGVPMAQAPAVYERANALSHIEPKGVAFHIGSQITETTPFSDAVNLLLDLVESLAARGIVLQHVDLGGGLGIQYKDETPPDVNTYVASLLEPIKARGLSLDVGIEPGRWIIGNAGVLLTRVEYLKPHPRDAEHAAFCIVDAGMNDLLRPSLYQAYHDIQAVSLSAVHPLKEMDVVGPVCESADVLGTARPLSADSGDVLAVMSAGAYGFVMSSNYNSRPRPAEVLVDGAEHRSIRARETLDDLIRGEALV